MDSIKQYHWLLILVGIALAFLVVLGASLVYHYNRPNGLLTKRAMSRRKRWADGIVGKEWLVREPMEHSVRFGFGPLILESHDAKRKKLALEFLMDHPDYIELGKLINMDVVVFDHRSDPGMQWTAKRDYCAFLRFASSHHWP